MARPAGTRIGMFTLGLLTASALLASGPGQARAEMCHQSVAVRINAAGLEFVADKVIPLLPTELEVPELDAVVVDWPLTEDDARVQTQAVTAKINLHQLRLYFAGGNLHIAAKADVSGGSPVTVLNPYASFGSAQCQAKVKLSNLSVDVGAQITTGGRIRVLVNEAAITFDNDQSTLALEGCVIGDIVTTVVDFIRNYFMTKVEAKLAQIAKEKIPALVQEKLSEAIRLEGNVQGYAYAAELQALDSDPYGVEAVLGAELGVPNTQTAAPCLSNVAPEVLAPQKSCIGVMPRLDQQQPSMFGAGISEALLNNGLHSLWRGGTLCMTSEELILRKPEVAGSLDELTAGLGMEGSQLGFAFQLRRPPFLQLSEGSAGLVLNEAHLSLSLSSGDGQADEINIDTDLVVRVLPTISPRSGTVGVDLRDISVRKLDVVGKGAAAGLRLDAARIERFLEVVVVPALQQKIAGLALSPAVIGFEEYLIELKAVRVRDGYIGAYVDAYINQRTDDQTAPETQLVEGPKGLVGPQMVTIYVAGLDNETPNTLMQFSYRVDGGAWTKPSFNRRIDTISTSGIHRVEVASIDLQGNRDPSPLLLEFEVDAEPPVVQMLDRPAQLVDGDATSVRFRAIDGRTATADLAFQARLFRVPDGGGSPEIVETQPFVTGIDSASFSGLRDGVYRIRITARDEAGNVSSEDTGFAVEQGGCSLAGEPRATGALPLLALALLALARRRIR